VGRREPPKLHLRRGLEPGARSDAGARPLLITSRSSQFTELAATKVLAKAPVIELRDLTHTDLVNYLLRTARPGKPDSRGGRATIVWDPVLDRLGEQEPDRASGDLATVLRTPPMVTLAGSRYGDTIGQNPADLVDDESFPGPAALAGVLSVSGAVDLCVLFHFRLEVLEGIGRGLLGLLPGLLDTCRGLVLRAVGLGVLVAGGLSEFFLGVALRVLARVLDLVFGAHGGLLSV
jgi:hypothetical protein